MTAISSAGWNGMAFIDDMRSGVMDRMLVSPVWRSALNVGNLVYSGLTTIVQSLIIIGVGLLVGAHFPNGVAGVAALIVARLPDQHDDRRALERARARRAPGGDPDRARSPRSSCR